MPPAEPSPPPPGPGASILVVNDDPTQLRFLCGSLEKDHLQAISCSHVRAALDRLHLDPPIDLLITDLHMPDIDGWRFCRLLRSREFTACNHIPILVVSATFAGSHADDLTRALGANAFLSLPCPAADLRRAVHALLAGQIPLSRHKALIVEDSPTLARRLAHAFRDHGYEPTIALTGRDARHLFPAIMPDLVILDYHLPDLRGIELLREFRQAPWCVPIIMITADTNPKLAYDFLYHGAHGYLTKPFDPGHLLDLCDRVRQERALLRIEDTLEGRTRELREAHRQLQASQARLQDSEERYRLLVDNLPALVFTGYPDFSIDFFDDKVEELTGYYREDFGPGRLTWDQLVLPEDRPGARQTFLQALRSDKKYVREYRLRHKDGDIRWLQERSRIILDNHGRIARINGIFYDISERRRLRDEQLKLAKLESVGLLAAGIAHDFNNLLTAILGNISLIALSPDLPPHLGSHLASAEQACLRAHALSHQFLTFAKGGAPVKEAASPLTLLPNASQLALAGTSCTTAMTLPSDLWPLSVDPAQINQALHNLLVNAAQAMPAGGTIFIQAENVVLTGASDLPLSPGPYVKIAITDMGPGIDPTSLPRIFDPYFTTKPGRQGLGLTIAFSIAQKHSGHLTVASPPGTGATFSLYLPASPQPLAPSPAPALPVTPVQGKILVMDDEPLVSQIAGKMLTHLGFTVEYAAHGIEALEKYSQARDAGQPFNAVLLDLTIPGGLGGRETMARLRELDPQVRAVVNSGYADDPILTHYQDHGFRGCLKKPYRLQDFSRVMQAVLQDAL